MTMQMATPGLPRKEPIPTWALMKSASTASTCRLYYALQYPPHDQRNDDADQPGVGSQHLQVRAQPNTSANLPTITPEVQDTPRYTSRYRESSWLQRPLDLPDF